MEKLSPLRLRLKQAIEWLKVNKSMQQKDIAKLMGMAEASFSRGLKRCNERDDTDFVVKFHQATKFFNLDWLLDAKEPMLAEDFAQSNQSQSESTLDPSSVINVLVADYTHQINRLEDDLKKKGIEMEERLAEKNARIADLQRTIADKEEIIKARDARIIELERKLAAATTSDLSRYPFTMGAAEDNK